MKKKFFFFQVKTNFRTAITVPEKSWCRFRDILADYCEKIKQTDQIQQPMVRDLIFNLNIVLTVVHVIG